MALESNTSHHTASSPITKLLGSFLFASRWILVSIYLGLVAAQVIYALFFLREISHLLLHAHTLTENELLLSMLGLIDIAMIANLILMITLGGYDTFVSNLRIENHPDRPEWLQHINASALKVKLATALVGISSVHLLKTFVNASNMSNEVVGRQLAIHLAFILSSFVLARIDPPSSDSKH